MTDWWETRSGLMEEMHQRRLARRRDQARWQRRKDVLLKVLYRELRHLEGEPSKLLRELERDGFLRLTPELFVREGIDRWRVDFITFTPHVPQIEPSRRVLEV